MFVPCALTARSALLHTAATDHVDVVNARILSLLFMSAPFVGHAAQDAANCWLLMHLALLQIGGDASICQTCFRCDSAAGGSRLGQLGSCPLTCSMSFNAVPLASPTISQSQSDSDWRPGLQDPCLGLELSGPQLFEA